MSISELRIPGKTNPVKKGQLIDRSKYFTWGEALHDLERTPENSGITANIIKLAAKLDIVRDAIGTPIIVQSWYRDPYSNRLAGGVSNSNHLEGLACDWHPLNEDYLGVKQYLLTKWEGGLGCYGDWFHTDIGLFARWDG